MQLFSLFLTVLSFLTITLAVPVSDEEWQRVNARAAQPEAAPAVPVEERNIPTEWPTPSWPKPPSWPTPTWTPPSWPTPTWTPPSWPTPTWTPPSWPTPTWTPPSWPTPTWTPPAWPTKSIHHKPHTWKRAVAAREALPTGMAPEIPADVLEA